MNLNEIDFQKLHLQSKSVQLLVAGILAIVLVVAGYFLVFQSQWTEYQEALEKEETLKKDYESKSIRAANLENLKQELVLIEDSIQILLKQLPTNAEIPALIQELHQAAAKNNLTMTSVIPQQSVVENPIERLPFSIAVSGSYDQLVEFTRDIGRMSRIVTLSNMSLNSDSNNKQAKGDTSSKLSFTALANTYKAVDTPVSTASSATASQAN